jgi:hydrogenase/urease accessory protein HupE
MRSWLVAAFVAFATPVAAHPAPFSYIDVRLGAQSVELTVVAHIYDLAHDLEIVDMSRLLDADELGRQQRRIHALLSERLSLRVDGAQRTIASWSLPEALGERQSVRVTARSTLARPAGSISLSAWLFPYDPVHQTFVNVYERDALMRQAILGQSRSELEYFAGTRQGTFAVVRRFVAAGVHHILIGPDHLLFLVGLLLLGGSLRQLVLVVTAFTAAHSVTLSLAALNILSPPARIVEPAIALSIVYVGADNLTVRGGRDVRAWIAFGFGLIHGFGFASVLREMDLPSRALGWSLFSFNVGVEIGQLVVVIAVATMLAAIRARSEVVGRRLAFAGSLVVIAAGAFWFIERVFFPGGIA